MTIEKKLLGTSPSGGATDVADVFSTDLYDGSSSSQTINNGIDLAGEGGMVWQKLRVHPTPPDGQDHYLRDTVRGGGHRLYSNKTNAESGDDGGMSPNSNGFSIGSGTAGSLNGAKYVSWTFRKKKKFFDIVTYTGNGVAGREIPHGLGGPVGMMTIKQRNGTTGWATWHKGANSGNAYLELNEPDAQNTNGRFFWGNNTSYIAPTSTEFTVATDGVVNDNGQTYVAYLFADNSSEDADDQMIKCGSFTGNGSATGPVVNLGWEPQFLITKVVNSNNWNMWDSMRGITAGSDDARLYPNLDNAEDKSEKLQLTSTGFQIKSSSISINTSGVETIYMAIRAPMMVEPEAATDVFAVAAQTGASGSTPRWVSGFVTDMTIQIEAASSNHTVGTRMLGGNVIYTDATNAASGGGGKYTWDYMTGFGSHAGANAANNERMWKRAKGYMDVVTWKGTGSARTIPHSLGVVPEMIWTKNRTTNGTHWAVYHKDLNGGSSPQNYYVSLNNVTAEGADNDLWNNTAPSSTVFTVRANEKVNSNNANFIGYLFATLAGISKVGSYTGNGSNQTINCGFSSGARFILIKRTNASGDWYVWDSVRGIVAGNDPHLSLNTSAAQVTSDDSIDPANAGFIVNQVSATNINVSSGTYIFYAIA